MIKRLPSLMQFYVLPLLLLAVIWGASFHEIERNREAQIRNAETTTALKAQAFAENTLSNIKRLNELLLDLRANWSGDYGRFAATIRARQESIGDITFQIGIIDAAGYLVYSNLAPAINYPYLGDREHFRVHRDSTEDRLFISKPLKGKVSGKWSIQLTRPIYVGGAFKGVIVASVSPETFVNFRDKLNLGQNAIITMARDSGEIMARAPAGENYFGLALKGAYTQPNAPIAGNFTRLSQTDHLERIFGYYKLNAYHLTFFVAEPMESLLLPQRQFRQTVLLYAGASSVVLMIFMILLYRLNLSREQARARLQESEQQHRQHLEELVQQRTAALMETEARASHLLQSSADGLYGVDQAGMITFINPAACSMLGYRTEQVIGRRAHDLFHHSKPDGSPYPLHACPSHAAVVNGQPIRNDNEVYWHADGHAIPVMFAVHPMLKDGVNTGAVISFVDMSTQRSAAQARERTLEAAENLARVRSEFLANMSHEIRTPLNGVLGFADIGQRHYRDSERARDAFAKIQASGKRLLGVINDVLDFSKIEAGKLNIEQTEVSIGETIGHAIELVRERADAKHLALTVDLAPDLPRTCISDPLRIGQVLINVLSNAVKFTEQGSVTLSVSRQENELRFRVVDTGIGMNESQQAELFNPFHQADASASRRFGGTGLGLAISKRILELMNGDIAVQSQPGMGTTVEFRLPYVPAGPVPAAPADRHDTGAATSQKPLAGFSFLVAEDEEINQAILEENLTEDGARVVMVGNGREALERVLRDGRDAYDLVLMDIQMPEMDGYEATRRILELAPDLPIIAQTAHAFSEERARCLAAGMIDHIAKPIDPAELVRLVHQHVPPRIPAPHPQTQEG